MANNVDRPKRPDTFDLIGPEYDRTSDTPAQKTLVICSAPRTGSYELCRLLTAAGVGVPHEYFHPRYGPVIGERFGIADPLGKDLPEFILRLRTTRACNDVFAFKLQPWMLKQYLMNESGKELLHGATFVHLFRPDIVGQFRSFRRARTTGRWDHNESISTDPAPDGIKEALADLDSLVQADAALRRLFALLGASPVFITTDELLDAPRECVYRVAKLMEVAPDAKALGQMIELGAKYGAPEQPLSMTGAQGDLSDYAFKTKR